MARQGETLNPSLDAQVNLVRALAKPEKKPEVVAKELARHCIDTTALSETRFADEGS